MIDRTMNFETRHDFWAFLTFFFFLVSSACFSSFLWLLTYSNRSWATLKLRITIYIHRNDSGEMRSSFSLANFIKDFEQKNLDLTFSGTTFLVGSTFIRIFFDCKNENASKKVEHAGNYLEEGKSLSSILRILTWQTKSRNCGIVPQLKPKVLNETAWPTSYFPSAFFRLKIAPFSKEEFYYQRSHIQYYLEGSTKVQQRNLYQNRESSIIRLYFHDTYKNLFPKSSFSDINKRRMVFIQSS